MSKKRRWLHIAILGVFVSVFLAVWIRTTDNQDSTIQFYNDIPSYENLLGSFEHPLHIAYELQAIPFIETGIAKAYRTDFVNTIIIAVDRDQIQDEIVGWNCLRTGDYEVRFNYKGKLSHIDFGYTILSMVSGLDYEDSGYNNTIHLLRHLRNNGRLISGDPFSAPVAIMFDYQAAHRVKAGQNVEIIVPSEGTLSFPAGVMSTYTDQLPDVNPEDLLAAGFRLPNGECDSSIYPDIEHYASAKNAVLTPESAMQALNSIASFRRQVLRERLFSPANGAENILVYLLFIIIIVLWSGLLYVRISDKIIQKILFAIIALLLFWMLIRVIKMLLPDGSIDRFFWYLFYIPLAFLPFLLFWIGQVLNGSEKSSLSRWIRKVSFLISLILVLLVLTNDFHQMAFIFYRGTEGNNYDLYYTHDWVYYLVFAWSLFLILAFVFMIVRNRNDSLAKRVGPLILLLGVSVFYFGGYSFGLPILRESEFSIVYGMLVLSFLEICFRNRLIPNNIRLGELLHNAPIEMYILSDAMQIKYKTDYAAEMPAEIIEKVRLIRPETNAPLDLILPDNESIVYDVYRINGGYVIFVHHLDSVIKLRSTLAEQNKKITIQNNILARTHKVKSEFAKLQAQQELFARIDGALKERVTDINIILSTLSTDSENKDELLNQLSRIKVLTNYCKRRGNLALLEAGDEYCDTASLALWIQESIWEVNAIGIDGLVTEVGNTQIHSDLASLLYDCFERVLEYSMNYESAVLLANLSVVENSVILRIVIETVPTVASSHFNYRELMRNGLDVLGASYKVIEHDETVTIEIAVSKEGRDND